MQRTVGPCHRDRKQKRNEKSEERRATPQQPGEGVEAGGKCGMKGVPPGDSSVVGQPGPEGIRQQMPLMGVDNTKGQSTWLWGRGRKGESAKATVSAEDRGQGRRECPRAGSIRPQEHRRPGKPPVSPNAWNQHECQRKPSLVSSRAEREDR